MLRAVRRPLIPFIFCAFFGLAIFGAYGQSAGQPPGKPPSNTAPAPFFSGFVAELSADSLTITRKGTGKELLRRVFMRDAKTKVEGNLKTGARVTVRYEAMASGDRAARIIVH